MPGSGTNRMRLSQREGAKNTGTPSAIRPLSTGPGETKIPVHGGGNTTSVKVHGSTGAESKVGCHQGQGADTKVGNHQFDRNFRGNCSVAR